MAKKNVSKEENVEITWADKEAKNRPTLVSLGLVVSFLLIISFWHMSSLRENSKNAWQLLGKVLGATVDQVDPNLKIDDLSQEVKKLVRQSIKSKDALPPHIRNRIANLDELPLEELPASWRDSVLRKHYLGQLQREIEKAQNTTAAPWIYYVMANLHFAEGNHEQTREIYSLLANNYPYHLLFGEVQKYLEYSFQQATAKKKTQVVPTVNLLVPEAQGDTKVAVTTSKGTFSLKLVAPDSSSGKYFLSLVKSGFYNGLVWYGDSPQKIHVGCPMATGLGGAEIEGKVDNTQEGYLQRGLVVLEHDRESNMAQSRFYILKQYSFDESDLHPIVVLGVIDKEGMGTVDQLGEGDLLLGAAVEENVAQ